MANRYWVGGAGTWDNLNTSNWSTSTGGVSGASVPTSVDSVFFDSNSGTGVVSVTSTATSYNTTINSATIELSLTGNPTICTNNGVLTLTSGVLTLNTYTLNTTLFNSSGSTVRTINFGTGDITLTSSGQRILDLRTIANLTITGTPVFNAVYSGAVGTRTIETGALSETSAVTLNVTAGTDIITNAATSNYKNLNFTGFAGTWNSAAAQTAYGNLTVSAGLTVGASTASLTFGGTSGTQFITTNGKTLNRPLAFNGVGGTFAFQDALTQGSTRAFTVTNGTVQLKNGVTSTVGSFITSGTNQKFLQSTLAGSQATLSQASGTINANNLNIRDINAAGGATWNAYVDRGNTDAGNNLGWTFGASPQASYEITYRLRSFSTPRRF